MAIGRAPDPRLPVEAEKSGIPRIIVSAVGESPRVTPSTSTPWYPKGLSNPSLLFLSLESENRKKEEIFFQIFIDNGLKEFIHAT